MIENIPPGEYRLYATRTGGYVPGEYGQRTPTGRGISLGLRSGEKKTDIQLSLTPTGSISGRVYDRDGEPAGESHGSGIEAVLSRRQAGADDRAIGGRQRSR